ncbi:MAG: NUDIX hydrolase [Bacteroidota bacterium]
MVEKWEKTGETLAYKGYRSILRKHFILPNGREADYDIVKNHSFVTIVALTEEEDLLLVKQFRAGPEMVMLNLPAGYIDQGESPEEAAVRELREETGHTSEAVTFLKKVCRPYTTVEEFIFLAQNCRLTHSPEPDEDEFLEIIKFNISQFRTYLRNSDNFDFDGIAAFYLALEKLHSF